jgi:hypothetical protein
LGMWSTYCGLIVQLNVPACHRRPTPRKKHRRVDPDKTTKEKKSCKSRSGI